MKIIISFILTVVCCGCMNMDSIKADRVMDKCYAVKARNVPNLEGPYKVKKCISANVVLAEKEGKEFLVTLRGCLPTDNEKLNNHTKECLQSSLREEMYLLPESIIRISNKEIKAIVYTPANRVWIRYEDNGDAVFENLSYVMKALLYINTGELIVDHQDKSCPFYDVFSELEMLAKKQKKGCWGEMK